MVETLLYSQLRLAVNAESAVDNVQHLDTGFGIVGRRIDQIVVAADFDGEQFVVVVEPLVAADIEFVPEKQAIVLDKSFVVAQHIESVVAEHLDVEKLTHIVCLLLSHDRD